MDGPASRYVRLESFKVVKVRCRSGHRLLRRELPRLEEVMQTVRLYHELFIKESLVPFCL